MGNSPAENPGEEILTQEIAQDLLSNPVSSP